MNYRTAREQPSKEWVNRGEIRPDEEESRTSDGSNEEIFDISIQPFDHLKPLEWTRTFCTDEQTQCRVVFELVY
ncbi:MAG: hypothetical protein ACJAQ6_000876 [Arenicella sp.]|jgi:hypothetical protein